MNKNLNPRNLPVIFGDFLNQAVFMYYRDGKWTDPFCADRRSITLSVNASVCHYGQGIFEGMRACLLSNGDIGVFRLSDHGPRLTKSANRMRMPSVPMNLFTKAFELLLQGEVRSLLTKGAVETLYIRPSMVNIEETLSPNSAKEFLLSFTVAPLTNKFVPLSASIEKVIPRASEDGAGGAKAAGNYGGCLIANKEDYDYVLFAKKILQEFNTMSIFFEENGDLFTPALHNGLILDSITRRSIITLAKKRGLCVYEVEIKTTDFCQRLTSGKISEVFGCGTASILIPFTAFGVPFGQNVVKHNLTAVPEIAHILYGDLLRAYRGEIFPHWAHVVPLVGETII